MTIGIDEALELNHETQSVDFKRQFDPSSSAEWCELTKDLVAMANSGGGVILVGLEDDGTPVVAQSPLGGKTLDPADIANKVFRYTGKHLRDVQVIPKTKARQEIIAIAVPAVRIPFVFSQPGTYQIPGGKQKTAFGLGTLYFRHGAKSEVATTEDLRMAFDRELIARREEWLGNIRRVIEAPPGSVVQVVPTELSEIEGRGVGVRLVHDPSAPTVPQWSPDDTHPYRQKELLAAINERFGGTFKINSFDVQCVRRAYDIESDPNFFHKPRHGSPQYSNAFVEWLHDKFQRDPKFFHTAREKAKGTGGG
jgi:hypothetical protein